MVGGGKMKLITIVFVSLLFFVGCQEKKQSNSEKLRSQAAAILLLQSGNCAEFPQPAIGGTSRTEFNFSGASCIPANVGNVGFIQVGLKNTNENGLVGENSEARLASTRSFSKDGKVNIEVTYKLTASDSYLDVIGNASVNQTTAIAFGPTFRIRPTKLQYLVLAGLAENDFSSSPQSPIGQFKTLCLEIHQEGAGSHMFGWSKACSALTEADRGNYEFDQEDILFSQQGSSVGFVLNKVVLQKVIISSGKLGTSGSIQFFPIQ